MGNDITATEIQLLNAAITNENIAYYGSYDKNELATAFKVAYSQIGFLSRSGLVDVSHTATGIQHTIIVIYTFNDRWRLAKKLGSYELLLKHENDERLKADRIKKYSELLTIYQKKNAAWQKKWGNKLVVSNIAIAIASLISSLSIAMYLNSKKAPIENKIEIKIDSTLLNKLMQNNGNKHNDSNSTKEREPKIR